MSYRGRYRLLVCAAETGHVLSEDGSRRHMDEPRFEPMVASLEEAERIRDRLLARLPFAEVTIFDPDGAVIGCFSSPQLRDLLEERRELYRWLGRPWPFRLLWPKPKLKFETYWRQRSWEEPYEPPGDP